MVREPAADAAAQYARTHPSLGVGLHVDLGEWSFQTEARRQLYDLLCHAKRDGY